MSTNQLSSPAPFPTPNLARKGLLASAGSDSGKESGGRRGSLSLRPLFPLRKATVNICILIYSLQIPRAGSISFPFLQEKEGEVRNVSTRRQWVLGEHEVPSSSSSGHSHDVGDSIS